MVAFDMHKRLLSTLQLNCIHHVSARVDLGPERGDAERKPKSIDLRAKKIGLRARLEASGSENGKSEKSGI